MATISFYPMQLCWSWNIITVCHHEMTKMKRFRQALVGMPLLIVLGVTAGCTQKTLYDGFTDAGTKAGEEGRLAEAEKSFSLALQEAEKFDQGDPRLPTSLDNLATVYEAEKKYAEGEALFKRSLAIDEKILGPNDSTIADRLEVYSELLRKMGKTSDADKVDARIKAIRAEQK